MKLFKMTALAAVLATTAGFAQAAVDANFGVTSNYLWRGVSQSADAPSVSGGIDYSDESGFYAGTWMGSIDFGAGSGTENDYYIGYAGEADGFGYDVGYVYYAYPQNGYEDSNFGEVYFNGSYESFGFGIAYTVNSEVADGSYFDAGDMYYSASYGFDLENDYSVGFTVGYYDFDVGSAADYSHFQVDIAKGDFVFTISKAEDTDGVMTDDSTKFVVSWGASF